MNVVTAEDLGIAPLTRDEVFALATEAIERERVLLEDLSADEWERPTACPAWTVRQVVIHQVASAQTFLSPAEGMRQQRAGKQLSKQEGLSGLDGLMQAGQRARDGWTAQQALEQFSVVLPKYARFRRRFPAPLRQLIRVPVEDGKVTLGYLFDRVINRDHFMHRLDIAAATGREPVITADHDGRLIQDLVAEWADLHGQAFSLELTGPAGGQWVRGQGGEHIVMDAIEFARVLSGRGRGTGLCQTQVLF